MITSDTLPSVFASVFYIDYVFKVFKIQRSMLFSPIRLHYANKKC